MSRCWRPWLISENMYWAFEWCFLSELEWETFYVIKSCILQSIKQNWSLGQYLELVNVQQHRKALCKLIVSSHRLRIETGRWERPPVPREMRQCDICHQGVEDECHFVLVCPAYVHIRKRYIKQYHWKRPSMFNHKLVQLFNTNNRKSINGLAKYVFQAFSLRNEITRT